PEATRAARRGRRFLDETERRTLLEETLAHAAEIAAALNSGALAVPTGAEGEATAAGAWLDRVGEWSWARLEGERARFAAVYKPIPILPPDQYLSLVIQATEGCSYNECSFCTFYRDRPFRVKTPEALAAHARGVLALLGRGRTLRRSLFLADANAIVIAQSRLVAMLEVLNKALPMAPPNQSPTARAVWRQAEPWSLDGHYAFLSAPDALHKSAADFAELRALGLRRVYVGVESGDDDLRAFLRKQGRAADVRAAVATLKAGGLAVGLILMVGVGGAAYRDAHFAAGMALLESLPLGAGDLIYLSPFVSPGDAPYDADMAAAHLPPLDEPALAVEEARFRAALAPLARRTGVKVSRYDIREFVY
ncbi:MAG: radical SAM protein, partial [Caldilineaceae bacterium]